jgi:hypothetical protein
MIQPPGVILMAVRRHYYSTREFRKLHRKLSAHLFSKLTSAFPGL